MVLASGCRKSIRESELETRSSLTTDCHCTPDTHQFNQDLDGKDKMYSFPPPPPPPSPKMFMEFLVVMFSWTLLICHLHYLLRRIQPGRFPDGKQINNSLEKKKKLIFNLWWLRYPGVVSSYTIAVMQYVHNIQIKNKTNKVFLRSLNISFAYDDHFHFL